ncbi:MAG: GTPase ObgE [Acidimicrobiaceae bacterium]|nr:GTPase ObgE [Acidimicrobiaceae bacterium]
MSGFVDECNLHVTAGDGGAGCVAFRREAHVARGGPSGGDGGRGGDIWLVADRNVASLLAFRDHPHRRATNGKHGSGNNRHGARGDDLDVKVPVGTVVLDHGDHSQLADLSAHGERWLAAGAGEGGRGNARFLANRRRAPAFAEQGEFGERRWLRLELKLLADVAIVGFPNVGKSTFISRVSAAKPKIADYPFTTLEPNLGVVRLDDDFEMVLADIPGLIEGASEGRGLGHRFLRHVERARVLLVLIDLCELADCPSDEQLAVLLRELGRYRPELVERPRLVVGSRADTAPGESFGSGPVGRLSSATGEGVPEVLGELSRMVTQARASEPVLEVAVVHRPLPPSQEVTVRRIDARVWAVEGRAAVRAVALSDLTDPGALVYAQDRLRSLGVERVLARAGAAYGDEVRIGDFSFTYQDDAEAAVSGTGRSDR